MLRKIREQQNLTQEELSEKSNISVRTIQRIEAGTLPKGHTLRILAQTLGVSEKELLAEKKETQEEVESILVSEKEKPLNYSLIKLINISSLPFAILPPVNILLPLILMLVTKQKSPIAKQIISVQIMWTIIAPIVFMLVIFMKLGRRATLITMILLVLSNVFMILRNAVDIDRRKQLCYKLNFSMV